MSWIVYCLCWWRREVYYVVGECEEVPLESMECGDNSMAFEDNNSMERISCDLVTFSQLPASRWKHLLNLDVIRVI